MRRRIPRREVPDEHGNGVAREMLARNDWVSLWWAHEHYFWSKPILIFWMEGLSMSALGMDFAPDAHPAHPEWAIRLPAALLAIVWKRLLTFAPLAT